MNYPLCKTCEHCKQAKAIQYNWKTNTCTGFEPLINSCLFCNVEQEYPEDDRYWSCICGDKDEDTGWSAQYSCPDCGASGPYVSGYASERDAINAAIKAWNTRHEPIPGWLKNEIEKIKSDYCNWDYHDWEYARFSDSEQFNLMKGEINHILNRILSLKKPEDSP